MAAYIAAIAAFVIFVCAIPIKLAVALHLCSEIHFGAGAALLVGEHALRRARLRALGKKKHLPWKKTETDLEKRAIFAAAWKAAKHLLRHLRFEMLSAQGRIATSNAAHTALLYGGAQALGGALLSFLPFDAVHLQISADFSSEIGDMLLCCMVSVPVGHIILAALLGAWNYILRSIAYGKASN